MSGELSLAVTPRTPGGVTTMEDHGQVLSLCNVFSLQYLFHCFMMFRLILKKDLSFLYHVLH
jgi:hypothetical protein